MRSWPIAIFVLVLGGCPRSEVGPGMDLSAPWRVDLAAHDDLARLPAADLAVRDQTVPPDLTVACFGAKPPPAAWGASPSPIRYPLDWGVMWDAGVPSAPVPGTPAPAWALYDFQPKSCGFRATYGLDVFRGRPLVVALWSGG